MTKVAIIDSGVANLASVASAFKNAGVESVIATTPTSAGDASHLVLPGVGAFGAVGHLRQRGWDRALARAVQEDRPLLAICLGMQMLAEGSDEAPDVAGLGIIAGRCRALPPHVRVPHLGWNGVRAEGSCRYLADGVAAYANSYAIDAVPAGWHVAWTEHGHAFVAGAERGRTLACQFHPELSGSWGAKLIQRWLSDTPACPGTSGHASHLLRRIVPCLDVQDGRVVKGIRFQGIRDAGDPAERAAMYEQQGADEVVMLDIAASPMSRANQVETVRAVRNRLRIPLTVGGGVRTVADARGLLDAGADKVAVNTAAIRNPTLPTELADAFGSQCVVLAIDAKRKGDSWTVLAFGGREDTCVDAIQWSQDGTRAGAGEILLTSWDRDGTRSGCDVDLVSTASSAVRVPLIASGGVGQRSHVADAFRAGADAVLAASIFHDDDETVGDLKAYLATQGIAVRQ